jgi:uncharacterized cupin superfamily protein
MREAELRRTEAGLAPTTDGWFVLNARDARWRVSDDRGAISVFEGEQPFKGLGVNLNVLGPGQPTCLYHGEGAEEAFLVLRGEAVLVVEGAERELTQWDFVYCAPWTEHAFVGAGAFGCVLLAVGARPPTGLRFPVSELAARHGASVGSETTSFQEAYAGRVRRAPTTYRDGWLPNEPGASS